MTESDNRVSPLTHSTEPGNRVTRTYEENVLTQKVVTTSEERSPNASRAGGQTDFAAPEVVEEVFTFLTARIEAGNGSCRITVRAIAEALGIGRTTASKATQELLGAGRLRLTRRGTGKGYPACYAVGEPA